MVISPLILDYFFQYYSSQALDQASRSDSYPLRFRQLKFQSFQQGWHIPQRSIGNYSQLLQYVTTQKIVPAHVYATVLQFLNSAHLKTIANPAYCLSGPFVMDFDLKGHILYAREGFEELKERILDTVDLLHDWYGLSQFEYAFSGHKGFHLYVYDYPERCLKSTIWGYPRERYESQQRHRITWQLRRAGIEFDYPISTDTRRILRIPHTLHGKTGLRCTSLHSENELRKFTLEEAQPVVHSDIHQELIQVKVVRYLPPFIWEGETYSGKRGDYMQLPLSLAVLLVLQQDAIFLSNPSLEELLKYKKE